jgi:uncharacterized RDD family membrane protein YckC
MQEEISIFPEQAIIYASFWERFAAAFIDGLILLVPNLLITYLMTGSLINRQYFNPPGIVNIVIAWLYSALQESSGKQATIGKRAMNIKVTNMNGERPSFGQATGRHFGKLVSFIIIFIGYLMMLWNPKKQTLHDMMAGTLVLANNSGTPVF